MIEILFAIIGAAGIFCGYWWGRYSGYDEGKRDGYHEGAFDQKCCPEVVAQKDQGYV